MNETTTSNHSTEKDKNASIENAMKLLNKAIQDSRKEVKEVLERDFEQLKKSLANTKPEMQAVFKEMGQASVEGIRKAKHAAKEKVREGADLVDESIHQKPWMYIGLAAAIFAIMGFIFGRKSK